MSKMHYEDYLNVGFIQTNLDEKMAWFDHKLGKSVIPMTAVAEAKMQKEIQQGFRDLVNDSNKPNIIILPELTLPLGSEGLLERLCLASQAIVIAGMDFIVGSRGIQNKGIIIVPQNWPDYKRSFRATRYYFGKTHFSIPEKKLFTELGMTEEPDPGKYLFWADKFGLIGITICSDFFDLERFIIYRGRIQHLFVISHNQDTDSYHFLAEAIARLVFCNVIVCNTGFFGDSIAFAPYDKNYLRYIYRHKGPNLFSTQVVKLPVKDLIKAQLDAPDKNPKFKAPPPGYQID